jgi:hypothetical protein
MKLRIALILPLLALAFTQATPHTVVRGVALLDWGHMEDLAALGAPNFYGWGEYCGTRPNCTNMNRNWTLPQAHCYPVLLLGNEPTNAEPAGHPISASVAASVTVAIETACPGIQLVVANIHINNTNGQQAALDWLTAYYAAYAARAGHALTETVGLHCYTRYAGECESRLAAAMALPGFAGHFWITETQVVEYGPTYQATWRNLLNWYSSQPRIDRVYAWTNRQSPWLDMVNADGTLNADGQIYHDWTAQSWSAFAPMVTH